MKKMRMNVKPFFKRKVTFVIVAFLILCITVIGAGAIVILSLNHKIKTSEASSVEEEAILKSFTSKNLDAGPGNAYVQFKSAEALLPRDIRTKISALYDDVGNLQQDRNVRSRIEDLFTNPRISEIYQQVSAGIKLPYYCSDTSYEKDNFGIGGTTYISSDIIRLFILKSLYFEMSGKPDEAWNCILQIAHLIDKIENDPALIAMIARSRYYAMVTPIIKKLLKSSFPNEKQSIQLISAFQKNISSTSCLRVIVALKHEFIFYQTLSLKSLNAPDHPKARWLWDIFTYRLDFICFMNLCNRAFTLCHNEVTESDYISLQESIAKIPSYYERSKVFSSFLLLAIRSDMNLKKNMEEILTELAKDKKRK